jgi:hypothetical protein
MLLQLASLKAGAEVVTRITPKPSAIHVRRQRIPV